jgi:hypothetical protein
MRNGAARTICSTTSRRQRPAPAVRVSWTWGVEVVQGIEHGRDPPLRVIGGRSAVLLLGHQGHLSVAGRLQREAEPGDPAPDDQDVHRRVYRGAKGWSLIRQWYRGDRLKGNP